MQGDDSACETEKENLFKGRESNPNILSTDGKESFKAKEKQRIEESSPDMGQIDEDFFSHPKHQPRISHIATAGEQSEIENENPHMQVLFDTSKSPGNLNQTSRFKLAALDLSSDEQAKSAKRVSINGIRRFTNFEESVPRTS